MRFQTTRFILTMTGCLSLAALAFYGIAKGDAVTPPMCVTGIGTIVAGYQWSKAHTNAKEIEHKKLDQ